MQQLSAAIEKEVVAMGQGDSCVVLCPSCYSRFKSLRGTRAAGEAVIAEIEQTIQEHKSTLRHISLIGYSFGGIVAWWVAGWLQKLHFFGLQPLNFITIACPHLGATVENAGWFQSLRSFFVRYGGDRTGEELSLCDENKLLQWMSDSESPFYAGLAAFRQRSLYANLRGDRTVPFHTAYFPEWLSGEEVVRAELPGTWRQVGADFPHVFSNDPAFMSGALPSYTDSMPLAVVLRLGLFMPLAMLWITLLWPPLILALLLKSVYLAAMGRKRDPLPTGLAPPADFHFTGKISREAMARSLNRLGWVKYAALFTFQTDGVKAVHTHGHIVVRNRMHSAGTDVVRHIAMHMLHDQQAQSCAKQV